jgi:hypothetical protein
MAGKKVLLFDVGVYQASSITDGNSASQTVMVPVASGKVYAYEPNTTTDQTVYSDVSLSTPLAQPFSLDANGRAEVFVSNKIVKFVVKDSTDTTTIRTIDYVDGQRDTFEDNITFNGSVTFGASFGFSDGTVGSPGLQFSSDTNTGIRRIGADNMGIVAGGADKVDIDTTGIEAKVRIETIAGSAASPSLVSASDTDTGPYYPAANQYGISCGGTLVGEFTGTGFVLDQPIKVQDGAVSTPSFTFEGDTNSGLYHTGTADTWRLVAGGAEQAEVTTSGVSFVNGIDPGDTGTFIKTKVIQLGDWDMDATASITVSHGLTASKIRSVTGYVRDDAATTYYPIGQGATNSSTVSDCEVTSFDSTNVTLTRLTSGSFDGTDFNATTFNRGHIVVIYEA